MEEKEILEQVETLEASTREVKVKLDIDYKTLKYYNMFTMKYVRKIYVLYIVFIVILLAGIVYTVLTKSYLVTALMGAFAIYLLYQMLTFEKMIDKQLTAHFSSHRPVTQVYTITDEAISATLRDGKEPVSYEWAFVSSIYKTKDYYYLFIGKNPVIIDRNPDMIVEGDAADLEGIIQDKTKTKPYKVYEKEVLTKPIAFTYPDYDAMEEARKKELAEIYAEEEAKKDSKELEAEVLEDIEENKEQE